MAITKHVILTGGQDNAIHMGQRCGDVTIINRGSGVNQATPQTGTVYEIWAIADGMGSHAVPGGDGNYLVPAVYGEQIALTCVQLDAVNTPENPTNDTVVHLYANGPALVSLIA